MLKEFLRDIWQSLMMTDSQYNSFLSLILTISTTLLSIGISIFTLSTAFFVSKKDGLKEVSEQISQAGNSLILAKRYKALKRFIHVMKSISKQTLFVSISSIVTIVCVLVFRQFSFSMYIYIVYIPLIISVVYTCICLYSLIRWFLKK